MPLPNSQTPVPLPRHWPTNVKSAVLLTISLAHLAIYRARGGAANAVNPRVRQAAEIERLAAEVSLLREELAIKDDRLHRIQPQHRPHYAPQERMRILELKAARGWSAAQTSRAFLVDQQTIADWLRRIDEAGPDALIQLTTGPWRPSCRN